MSNLVKHEPVGKYQLALSSAKISEMKKADVVKQINDLLTKTYFDAGQVMPGYNTTTQTSNLQILTSALFEELKQFGFLRIDELKIAFHNGVRGEYGEFFGLNIKTFYQWIKGWQFDEKRKHALEAIRNAKETEYAPLMSKTEAEYEYRQTLKSQFSQFKKTGILQLFMPTQVFAFFERLGLITLTKEEKQCIYLQASQMHVESLKIARTNPSRKQTVHSLTEEINRIQNKQETPSDKAAIKSIACKIAITNYFNSVDKLEI